MKKAIIIVIAVALVLFGYLYYINYSNESIEALSKYGSSGEEVKKIQQKLKNWGYYNGNVDGIYGSKTQAAVKSFQKKNGLTQDRYSWTKNISSYGNYIVR